MAQVLQDLKQILLLDRFYFPDEQATSVYLTELTQGLRDKFEFEILCGPPLVVTEKVASPSFRIHPVPCLKFPKRFLLARLLNDLSFLFGAFFHGLFLKRPHLVVSQTSPPGIWWIGFLLSRWHRAHWVQVCQDIFPDNLQTLNGSFRGKKLFSFLNRVSFFPFRRADRILVVGEDMKKKLLEKGFYPQQVVTTHNWVDLEFVRPLPKENAFREKYRLADKFVVLYAGNFGRVHNFEDLIDAAEKLRHEPQIIFVLVGEGAVKEALFREASLRGLSNLLIVPFEPRSRLPEVLAAADVSVILLGRGMAGLSVPSKIYSILASGQPIVACVEEESDIARIVRESKSGFVTGPGEPEALARAVKELFEKPELKSQLGANARRYAEEKNFQATAFRDYERVFREVLDGR